MFPATVGANVRKTALSSKIASAFAPVVAKTGTSPPLLHLSLRDGVDDVQQQRQVLFVTSHIVFSRRLLSEPPIVAGYLGPLVPLRQLEDNFSIGSQWDPHLWLARCPSHLEQRKASAPTRQIRYLLGTFPPASRTCGRALPD